jgi:hypothetical protein
VSPFQPDSGGRAYSTSKTTARFILSREKDSLRTETYVRWRIGLQ